MLRNFGPIIGVALIAGIVLCVIIVMFEIFKKKARYPWIKPVIFVSCIVILLIMALLIIALFFPKILSVLFH
ncbi:hypothetical protein CEB3_c10270 [Peptococcaceae bacterium CEB3]|nr:hypothetical protein CEB3_c10270 [Peptococcaceae bacterium CEB3]